MSIRNFFLAMTVIALAACQTIEGFGEDVETGGQIIQDTSDDVQDDI